MTKTEKIYEPVPPFKDHTNCAGHANAMLDCTFEKQEEVDLGVKVLDYYIKRT